MPEVSLDLGVRFVMAFLLGSIPFAMMSMWGSGVDIRTVGSGNPGFNNVLRVSKPRSIICLIGDLGKGIVAILLLYRPAEPETTAWVLGLAVMLGHCYSPWLGFAGGKGVATSAGVMFVLQPALALSGTAGYIILRVIGQKLGWPESGAVASLSCFGLFALLVLVLHGLQLGVMAFIMFAIVLWRHKDNLRRFIEARAG